MKKLFVIIISVFILSCNDPVFYSISMEEIPLDPRIAGPSTNFVELNGKVYTAAKKRIYWYDTTNRHIVMIKGKDAACYCDNISEHDTREYTISPWNELLVNKRITHLAATTNKLYALAENKILSFSASDTLTPEDDIPVPGNKIEGIFASGDLLFIGTPNFEILYLTEGDASPVKIEDGSFSRLCGVVNDGVNYYLCNTTDTRKTENDGIFIMSTPGTVTLIPESTGKEFTSIINLNEETIVAMTRGGNLYKVTSTEAVALKDSSDGFINIGNRKATSALGIWKKGEWENGVWAENTDNPERLLLVGRQDLTNSTTTGYTHGYVEIQFNPASGSLIGENFSEPGRSVVSSMVNNTNEHYTSSIGKRGVNYFYQAPDGILFASLNHGVWSYRERSAGKFTWNAEE